MCEVAVEERLGAGGDRLGRERARAGSRRCAPRRAPPGSVLRASRSRRSVTGLQSSRRRHHRTFAEAGRSAVSVACSPSFTSMTPSRLVGTVRRVTAAESPDVHRAVHLASPAATPGPTGSLRSDRWPNAAHVSTSDRRHSPIMNRSSPAVARRWPALVARPRGRWFAAAATARAAAAIDDSRRSQEARSRDAERLRLDVPAGLRRDGDPGVHSTSQPAVTVTYAGGGSGKGQTDLAGRSSTARAPTAPCPPADLAEVQGRDSSTSRRSARRSRSRTTCRGVTKLQLSADTIAKIFQGTITTWNDPAITADNPGVDAAEHGDHRRPPRPTARARRRTSPSTSRRRRRRTGRSAPTRRSPGRPSTQGGNGNAGVAQIVQGTDGAIGYVDFSDAKAAGLTFAAIKNQCRQVRRADRSSGDGGGGDGDGQRRPDLRPAERARCRRPTRSRRRRTSSCTRRRPTRPRATR